MSNRVQQDFELLSQKYQGLSLTDDGKAISGLLFFSAEYEGNSIDGSFEVEILLDENHPDCVPKAKEIGGKIPSDFHKNPDGTLCLASYLEAKEKFYENPCLIGFTENLLIPYLYSFSVFKKTGQMPFGELGHGNSGIFENYKEIFDTDDAGTMALLMTMAEKSYRGHLPCPCGSGIKGRSCHGEALLKYSKFYSPEEFLEDFIKCGEVLYGNFKNWPADKVSKKLLKSLKKVANR